MPELERLAIEHSCIRLMAVYCNAVDDWDLDTVNGGVKVGHWAAQK